MNIEEMLMMHVKSNNYINSIAAVCYAWLSDIACSKNKFALYLSLIELCYLSWASKFFLVIVG